MEAGVRAAAGEGGEDPEGENRSGGAWEERAAAKGGAGGGGGGGLAGDSGGGSQFLASLASASTDGEITVGKGRFVVRQRIGRGSFGEIFRGYECLTGRPVAIKVEDMARRSPHLLHEWRLYKMLYRVPGVPRVFWGGAQGAYCVLVMELLGPSIEDLFEAAQRKFSTPTAIFVALQMVAQLEAVHERGIVHRDIKPHNFTIGLISPQTPAEDPRRSTIYILDFGLSKRYRDAQHVHIPYRDGRNLTGTARYVSINTHLGVEPSRRDDLESVCYVLIYLLKAQLPWQGLRAATKKEKYVKIMETKSTVEIPALCAGLPAEIAQALEYCRGLRYTERPDYSELRALLQAVIIRRNIPLNFVYDWDGTKVAPRPAPPPGAKAGGGAGGGGAGGGAPDFAQAAGAATGGAAVAAVAVAGAAVGAAVGDAAVGGGGELAAAGAKTPSRRAPRARRSGGAGPPPAAADSRLPGTGDRPDVMMMLVATAAAGGKSSTPAARDSGPAPLLAQKTLASKTLQFEEMPLARAPVPGPAAGGPGPAAASRPPPPGAAGTSSSSSAQWRARTENEFPPDDGNGNGGSTRRQQQRRPQAGDSPTAPHEFRVMAPQAIAAETPRTAGRHVAGRRAPGAGDPESPTVRSAATGPGPTASGPETPVMTTLTLSRAGGAASHSFSGGTARNHAAAAAAAAGGGGAGGGGGEAYRSPLPFLSRKSRDNRADGDDEGKPSGASQGGRGHQTWSAAFATYLGLRRKHRPREPSHHTLFQADSGCGHNEEFASPPPLSQAGGGGAGGGGGEKRTADSRLALLEPPRRRTDVFSGPSKSLSKVHAPYGQTALPLNQT